jgi:gliding motility-associated protein GldL
MANKKSKSIFESKGWKTGMKYLYGFGAAIVIIGALFKILHLPGADLALIIGLSTEAVIFFFSAFEPLPPDDKHYEWERVYPELSEDAELPEVEERLPVGKGGLELPIAPKLTAEDIAKINKLTPDMFEALSDSVTGLRKNVQGLSDITDAAALTNDFSDKLKNASVKVEQLASGYAKSADTMNQFNSSLSKVKGFQEQIQNETAAYSTQIQTAVKNLSSLNAIYEIELQDAQKHITSINKFYGSISQVMQNLLNTSKDTDELRQEVSVLAKNMRTLNTVYGNMLTAMASGAKAS